MSPGLLYPSLLVAMAAIAACGPTAAGTCPTTSDSLGVSLVEYAPSFAACSGESVSTEPEPLFAIGEPAPELDRILGAVFQSDGGVVVADGRSAELLFFDPTGQPRARVGGEGGGPGEFHMLAFVAIGAGDSVFAYDRRDGRLSLFDRDGRFARAVRMRGLDTLGNAVDVGVLEDGEFVAGFHRRTGGTGLVRDSLLVVRFDTAGSPAELVGVFPHLYTHWGPHAHPSGQGAITAPLPVPFSSLAALAARDSLIHIGLADRYAVLRLDRTGLRRITRQAEPPGPITVVHRERLFALLPGAGAELEILRGLRGPATLPAFGADALSQKFAEPAILVTDAMGFWLMPFLTPDSAAPVWPRFGADGRYQGTVTLPARFRPTAVRGDIVLGVYRDTDDVESVRAYRLMAAH